jgi:hypothetical protein
MAVADVVTVTAVAGGQSQRFILVWKYFNWYYPSFALREL